MDILFISYKRVAFPYSVRVLGCGIEPPKQRRLDLISVEQAVCYLVRVLVWKGARHHSGPPREQFALEKTAPKTATGEICLLPYGYGLQL